MILTMTKKPQGRARNWKVKYGKKSTYAKSIGKSPQNKPHRVRVKSAAKSTQATTQQPLNRSAKRNEEIVDLPRRIRNLPIKVAIKELEEMTEKIKQSDIPLSNNTDFKILQEICLDKELPDIVRLKALEVIKEIDFKSYSILCDLLLRNISENIEFKINSVKVIDKSISVVSQGNSYVIGNGSVVNISTERNKSDFFINPKWVASTTSDLKTLVEEINLLYVNGNNQPVFVLTRVLFENYVKEILYSNFENEPNLWRKSSNGNLRSLNFSELIGNLFTKQEVLIKAFGNTHSDDIDRHKQYFHLLRRLLNVPAHSTISPTDSQVEELKEKINRTLPYLYKMLKK